MTIVVDASVIMKWIVPEEGEVEAASLRSSALIAPDIWFIEVGNGLWKHVARREMSADDPPRLIDRLRSAPIRSLNSAGYLDTALKQAIELNHPIYDCLYLSLAVREETFVVTADRRFASAVRRNGKWSDYVRLLSDL